ncbi:chorismate mutase [Pseudomonas syringae group sp. J309-1]|uniref:chorismate mutase n=1 Tax=Pseudomonas syringae group sp. J309-1 TaxID=3079588 RepID=UPI00290BAA07|nr:chorismate mutase [Pseudomonas syringae group sp. J309-1]MDU8358654.1 chorismate mutase [Pseudomonas syringae group sp. J309-1]
MPNSKHLLVLCATLAGLAACAVTPTTSPAPAALAPLMVTISERLAIADQVALTKWDSGKPIQDSPREAQVIAAAAKLAPTYNLDPQDVSQLLVAQIEANKLVQYALLAKWHEAGKAPDTPRPDLVGQIRPQLDQLQTRLLREYSAFAPYRQDPQCPNWLIQQSRLQAKDPIHDIALTRAVGELCVIRK